MADIVAPCETCGRVYNHSKIRICPGCAGAANSEMIAERKAKPSYNSEEYAVLRNSNETVERLLRGNIEASNRTTHAIRSVVSYIAIMAITTGLVYFIYSFGIGFAAGSGNYDVIGWTNIISGIIAVIGVITALVQFFSEWSKSKVPKY